MASNVVPARGMRDILPADKETRERAIAVIRHSYRAFGFDEIETPAVEDIARLTSGQGGENEKMLYKVLRRGLDESAPLAPADAVDLGLRFDLTLPLARFYATNAGTLPDVCKFIQIGSVWRAERPQKGRYRQFTQCDIDIIGEPGVLAEVELLSATAYAVDALGLTGTYVRLNDREVLRGLLAGCGVPDSLVDSTLITVDKLDKIGVDGVLAELASKVGLSADAVSRLGDFLTEFGALADRTDFDAVAKLLPASVPAEAVDRLREIRAALPDLRVEFDVSLVRGMGYYTGPIFEMSHPASAGSIAGGGRYDKMIGRFLRKEVPACGFSIGFERIVELVSLPPAESSAVAVLYASESPAELASAQRDLIAQGYRARLVKRGKKVSNQLTALKEAGFTHSLSLGRDDSPRPID